MSNRDLPMWGQFDLALFEIGSVLMPSVLGLIVGLHVFVWLVQRLSKRRGAK